MKTPRLAGESACQTLASKGLRFRGAGAFACQSIFLSHLDRRLQRSDTTSALVLHSGSASFRSRLGFAPPLKHFRRKASLQSGVVFHVTLRKPSGEPRAWTLGSVLSSRRGPTHQ